MQNRNGYDEYGKFILIAALLLGILSAVLDSGFLYYLSAGGCLYGLYRAFSRNIKARSQENQQYLGYISLWKMKIEMRREYKVFRCKSCGRNIRVPRGKGKIEVTCPLCGMKTIHKT